MWAISIGSGPYFDEKDFFVIHYFLSIFATGLPDFKEYM